MVLSGSGQLPCHHKMVIDEITRSHQLVIRLKALVLLSPPASGRCSPELASDLFDEVLQSYKVSIPMLLRPCNCYSEPAVVKSSEDIRALEEEKSSVMEQPERIDISYAPESRKESQSKTSTTSNLHLYGHQWRKFGKKKTSNGEIPRAEQQSWTTITAAPHLDGHQWRKYGEKHISNSEFPRFCLWALVGLHSYDKWSLVANGDSPLQWAMEVHLKFSPSQWRQNTIAPSFVIWAPLFSLLWW